MNESQGVNHQEDQVHIRPRNIYPLKHRQSQAQAVLVDRLPLMKYFLDFATTE